LFDSVVPGLLLRVRATRRSWYVWYRDPATNKPRWVLVTDPDLTAHEYPVITLERARTLARALLESAAAGRDVVAERKAADAARAVVQARTFGALAAEYIERYAKAPRSDGRPRKKTWREDARMIRTQLAPLANRPVVDIHRRDIRAILDAMVDRGAPVYANRVLRCVRKIFNYGIGRDWLEVNPAVRMQQEAETPRQRVLTDDELRALWAYLDAPPADATDIRKGHWPLLAAWVRLRLLTAQRGSEVVGMQWADLELDGAAPLWTIPDTKNGRVQRVPLSRLAVTILAELRTPGATGYVFAGIRSARWRKNLGAGAGVADLQWRDLRRTAATNLAAIVGRFTLARVLNHSDRSVTAVYDAYGYLPEKRAALDAWAARLQTIVSGLRIVEGARG
jgi:integrase